jgi:anhydro-N-acetylmuramic acid kinase
MANVTHLPMAAGPEAIVAFDTGPGNSVLDALARLASGGSRQHDEAGSAAARGSPSEALLSELLADPFFAQSPPRSTGRERFGERYASKVHEVGTAMGLTDDDVLATAVELTAASVATSIDSFLAPRGPIGAVFASGGGVHNATLMRALERRLAPARVLSLATLGVAPEAKEALAFAFLAHLTLCGAPGNVIGATGARHPVVLGHVTPGAMS